MNKKKILLIDTPGLAYRAFFALPPLKTAEGLPTNAVYGFTKMLLKIIEQEKPYYVAAAIDKGPPTQRLKEFPEYKIERHKQPEDLTKQFPLIEEVLKTLGIPLYYYEGYEADDCLATLAKISEKEGLEVLILSGDMDLLQTVSSNIKVLINKKGISELVYYDEGMVKKRFELTPSQLIDLKALTGDPSDNIRGVSGIGEVSAIKLLMEFGSLDNLIKNIAQVPDKYKEKIICGIESALLSRRLVTLREDLDLNYDLEKLTFKIPDEARWNDLIRRFEFKSLGGGAPAFHGVLEKSKINIIGNAQELKRELFKEKKISLFFYTLQDKKILAFSLKNENYLLEGLRENNLSLLGDLFGNPDILKIVYNIKDFYRLIKPAFNFAGAFDVMLASYLLDPEEVQPKVTGIISKHLNLHLPEFKELAGGKKEPVKEDVQFLWMANITRALYGIETSLEEKLKKSSLFDLYEKVELPLSRILYQMESGGIAVDKDYLEELSGEFEKTLAEAEREIFAITGVKFNLNSPKQVGEVLFEKLGLPVVGRTKTGYKTDARALMQLSGEHAIAEKILSYREVAKLKSTYVDAFPALVDLKTGRLHTNFNQTGTATGRLSSSEPNLQNIPIRTELGRLIRRAFIPANKNNRLVSADYSQIELRVLAHLSGDEGLIKAFKDDVDIHVWSACRIFNVDESLVSPEMRRKAKEVNFGILYGMSDFGLSERLKIKKSAAKEYIQNYFSSFPDVKKYIDNTLSFAEKNGYVCTILGRRRYIHDINSRNFALKKAAERMAVNATVQGSSADIIKLAMINLDKVLKEKFPSARLLLQVHDELILEVPKGEAEKVAESVKDVMASAFKLCVPVKVDTNIGF